MNPYQSLEASNPGNGSAAEYELLENWSNSSLLEMYWFLVWEKTVFYGILLMKAAIRFFWKIYESGSDSVEK